MVASFFFGPAHAQWHIRVHVEARRPTMQHEAARAPDRSSGKAAPRTALPLCEVEQTTQGLGQPTPLLPLAARTVST